MTESMYRLVTATAVITDEDLQLEFIRRAGIPNPQASTLLLRKRPVALEFTPVVPKVAQVQRNDPQRGWVNDQPVYRVPDLWITHPDYPDFKDSLIFQVLTGQHQSILVQLSVSHVLENIQAQLRQERSLVNRNSLLVKEQQILYKYQSYLAFRFGRRS